MSILEQSGVRRILIKYRVWKNFLCGQPSSVNLLVSHVITFPSNPDVTRRRVFVSYSMFFTQLAWPCSEHTFEFSFRRSHNAIVVSSEQVANKRLSKNLMLLTQSSWASVRVLMCLDEMGSNSRTSVCSQATVSTDPSGEYSRLNTAPWVCVLRLTDSTAGFIEQYKLVIVLKLSLAGSTNTPRLIVLLWSHENRLLTLLPSLLEPPPLPVCVAAEDGRQEDGVWSWDTGDPVALRSVREGEPVRGVSSSTSESSMSGSSSLSLLLLGLSRESSASSLSLWCSELIVASPASTQGGYFPGSGVSARQR